MKRHRLLGAFILFITATAASAPIAYLLGLAHGPAGALFVPEPDPAAFVDTTDAIWDCEQFGDFPGLRTIDIAIGCGPGMGLASIKGAANYVPKYGRQLAGGPLQRAAITAIAGNSFDPPGALAVPAPLSLPKPLALALAPAGGPTSSRPGVTGGVLPFVLPAGPLGLGEPETPPPGVPISGTLPLMITGLAGLAFALRQRARRL
jgi:hypothetical protein